MRKSFILSAFVLASAIIAGVAVFDSQTSCEHKLSEIGLANLQALSTGESDEPKDGFSRFPGKCWVSDEIAFILSGMEEYRNKLTYGCMSGAWVSDAQYVCYEGGNLKECTPYNCDKFIEDVQNFHH